MRWLILTILAGALLAGASTPDKPPKGKKTAKTSSLHAATPRSRVKKGKSARARKPPAPSYQLHPDAERYQQIQQALAERGYYKGPVDGNWNDDSVDALKRFQTDQKLEPDGKINALSLTGLGLGPKHDGTSAGTVPLSAAQSSPNAQPEIPPVTELPQGSETPQESAPQ
ncbi:MAG TPA: peptidoglycan-binding domain-containing protein [Bryobacteraceae bacterium]|jgi:peptidoglycan hydrolase-like protein with peptidoglycan-binding domain|nr:peptidoglycan-binding domain-containing protein [Bryobacteraceae bacterium]